MSLHPNQVLLAPVVSEKSYALMSDGKYTFRVHPDANKIQIKAAIEAITAEVARTEAIAQEKGEIYYVAQEAFDEAAYTAEQLQAQADEAQARADASRLRAGQFVAELARSGGGDLSASLLTNPGEADELLSRLGFASKITEQAEGIYAAALQDQNAAEAFTEQANVAKGIRDELRLEAQAAYEEAQVAAQAAQDRKSVV